MSILKNVPADIAHQMAETERMLIRAWDMQRRGRAAPDAETVSESQVERAAQRLEEIVEHLPATEREDVARLISIVRTRLDLAVEPSA